MADTDLVFRDPPGSTDLVFGAGSSSEPDIRTLAIEARRPARRGVGVMSAQSRLYGTAKRRPRRGVGLSLYDARVSRPIVNDVGVRFQQALPVEVGVEASWQNSLRAPAPTRARWQDSIALHAHASLGWQDAQRLRQVVGVRYQDARSLQTQAVHMRYQDSLRTARPWVDSRYQRALPLHPAAPVIRFQQGVRTHVLLNTLYQRALPVSAGVLEREGYGLRVHLGRDTRYQNAIRPPAGRYVRPVHPIEDPCYIPPPGGEVHLLFKDGPGTPHLVYVCERHDGPGPQPGETVVIPVREVYMILNNASLTRVDGNIPLANFGLSFGLDTDSWTWTFSATLPGNEMTYLEPGLFGDPVVVEAMVNGVPYRMVVESMSRERTFGQSSIRISGRGINAALDSPYAPILSFGNTSMRTAQQLMGDVLTENGVPMPWDVVWDLDDWVVPGGIWTYQGSYMGALNQIAQAAGGYIQPDRVAQRLLVKPRYPVAPWKWATEVTPDYEIPDAIATREGIEWLDKPVYNRVFVSGTTGGVLRRVTRAGTDGGLVAPTVVEALITDAPAGRQRGLAILADTGRQARVTLRMPVLAETGLILPGKFVRYVENAVPRVGLVRSMNAEVATPEIMQTLTLETHLD